MDSQKEKTISDVLKANKLQNIPFYQTQQQLLKEGYTESEIVYAMYSVPYDQTLNQPKPAHPLEQLYAEHPEQAQEIAKTLLRNQREDDWSVTALDVAAGSMGPDIQSRSYHDVLAADRLGIHYFTLLFIGVLITIAAIKFQWSSNLTHAIFGGYSAFVSLLFLFKLIIEKMRIKKT